MGRLIVLIVLVVAAVWLIRRALRGATSAKDEVSKTLKGELVSCARCGLHLPRGEARAAGDGKLYCSEEHARLGQGPR
jgi:uncharacterized protein